MTFFFIYLFENLFNYLIINNIYTEETSLEDFKRQKLQTALLIQLDALLEFGEKIIIIANYSRDIIDQISTETTPPGEPRKTYTGEKV
jgi:hypothetical protein